jgi:hypothetical protein
MLILLLIVVAVLAAGFVWLFTRLASRRGAEPLTTQWLSEFSIESYAPMERLLDQSDVAFLATQQGYRPEIGRRLMAERRKVFAAYLRELVQDFNRLMAIGKFMVVHSTEDRPEFARTLFRQQARFYLSVCIVRCQLALYPLGWRLVDARGLVQAVDTMRRQVHELALQRDAIGQIV